MLEVVECTDDAFYVVLSAVDVFRSARRNQVGEVCEAVVGVEVILLDVVLVVKRRLGHGAFFVYGHRYFAVAAPSRRNYFHSAGFLFIL